MQADLFAPRIVLGLSGLLVASVMPPAVGEECGPQWNPGATTVEPLSRLAREGGAGAATRVGHGSQRERAECHRLARGVQRLTGGDATRDMAHWAEHGQQ